MTVSLPLFYSLKDVTWYNLEHLPSDGLKFGRTDLKWMGSKYPSFMFLDSLEIHYEKIEPLLKELEEIRSLWSNDWSFVQLKCKTDNWQGGQEDPSEVIIYDVARERPSKYGYTPQNPYSKILDKNGGKINSNKEVVLCGVESKLGSYGYEPLMKNFLEKFIEQCKRCVKLEKGILIDITSYNYSN